MSQSWLLDFQRYFAAELEMLAQQQEQGLVVIDDDGIKVTPMGWFFVRGVAMMFDRHLQAGKNRARFSRII